MCPVTVDGRQLLASAGSDHTVLLWDPVTGRRARALVGHTRTINEVCPVTAGGRQLLASASSDCTARLWDPATGQLVAVLRADLCGVNTVCSVAVGGRPLVAIGGSDGSVRLWDPGTGRQAAVMQGPRARGNASRHAVTRICSVAVGGRPILAAGCADGSVRLWDPATARQAAVLHADPAAGQQSVLMPSASGLPWPVTLLRSVTGICSITVGERPILAAGGADGMVRLWDPATGQQTVALHGHEHRVSAVCPATVGSAEPLAAASSAAQGGGAGTP
jgi:WD40 repeat protein